MRVVIARTMPDFSMDVYADCLIAGLKSVRPEWEIVEVAPQPLDRTSRSWFVRFWKFYERFWHYPQYVQRQEADIFHVIDHSEGHIAYWLQKTGKPVVVTCHDLINFFYKANLQGSVKLPLISNASWRYAIRGMCKANQIISVSQNTAKDVTKILGIECDRITVVPNAVESIFQCLLQQERDLFRQQHQISRETTCLLNVGSNHPRKNILTILKVLLNLKNRQLPVHFWKTGADFNDEQKVFIKTHSLEGFITYLGQPDKQTLVQIYNAADILLAPSIQEGFGMTILEAMACGTPVITSNMSAMPEVAGDAGILVEPTDVQAIADAVHHLLNNPADRKTLIEKGIKRAKAFTWEATAEQIAKVYEGFTKSQKNSSGKTYSVCSNL